MQDRTPRFSRRSCFRLGQPLARFRREGAAPTRSVWQQAFLWEPRPRGEAIPASWSVKVAPIASLLAQLIEPCLAQQADQYLLNIATHAFQAAAYVQRGADIDPVSQLVAGIAQQVLHIALFRLIAGEGQVQPLQMAGSEPVFDFLLEEIVDRPLPLAE